jgi:hypothetical protein
MSSTRLSSRKLLIGRDVRDAFHLFGVTDTAHVCGCDLWPCEICCRLSEGVMHSCFGLIGWQLQSLDAYLMPAILFRLLLHHIFAHDSKRSLSSKK